MLSIPKYPEQYAQHFPAIFYLLCCASQHHVRLLRRCVRHRGGPTRRKARRSPGFRRIQVAHATHVDGGAAHSVRCTFGPDEGGSFTRTVGVIRSLGRHGLPHTYRKEVFRKLRTAACCASAVIPLESLRVQHPPAMYNPKASGMARFQAGVPPPIRVRHLANLPAIPAMRAVVGENVPAHLLLGPLQAGLSGILPLGPDMLATLVLNYAHQLNHPNPLTRASASWGLTCALWRLSPDMPCVLRGLADRDCHPTAHDGFLQYTWLMDIRSGLARRAIMWRCPSTP